MVGVVCAHPEASCRECAPGSIADDATSREFDFTLAMQRGSHAPAREIFTPNTLSPTSPHDVKTE
jgi:hypothetical protein